MNRKRRGFTSRLGTPSRSRLNTDDWYNLLFQQTNQQSLDEITNAVKDRASLYNKDTNFSRFMDATTVADDEFATVKAFLDKPKNELSEVIVTPEGATTYDEIKKQRESSREMLKTKKWLNGLSGDKSFSDKDNDELKQLDTWHDIIYRDNQYANQFKKYMWTPNTILERAKQQAEERIKSIVSGGAPEGYWLRTLKQIPSKIWEADINPLSLDLGYRNILGIPDPFYYIKQPGAKLYDALVYDDGEKLKSNLLDDISTTFLKRVNETQIDNSKGKIQRTQEMQLLGSLGMDQLKEAMANTDSLRTLKNELLFKQERGLLNANEVEQLRNIDKLIDNAILSEGIATKKLDTLSTYEAENPLTQAWSKLNYALDKIDFAYDLGIRDDLRGLKDSLRSLYHYRRVGDKTKSDEFLNKVNTILEKFNNSAEKAKLGWNKDIQNDEDDLKRITDKYNVSPYFEAQDLLSQELSIFSPKKALFSSAGLLGASMSSTPKSLLKLGSMVLGVMSGAGGVNYSMLGAAGLINLISGGALATDENNAEVGGTYSVGDFMQLLINYNVDKSVLNEGRKLLHDDEANLEDVITAFTRGEIMFNNKNNRNAMLNIIAGANQQWAYDMNATAPGVWIDAAITTIPDAAYARAIKFGKLFTPKALRQSIKSKLGVFDDLVIESNVGAQNVPLEELILILNVAAAKGIKGAMYVPYTLDMEVGSEAAKRAGIETIDALRTKFTVLSKMAKYMPNKWLGVHGPNIMRTGKRLATRSITGMSSEFWEEDVQSIRQHQRQNGEFGSEYISGAYNPKIILDNIFRGVRSSWDFVFKDPLHATQEEKEIWKEAKLGALGWLALGGIPVIAQTANGSWLQYTATEAAVTNILATKAEDDALIQKGIVFAQKAKSVDDYDRMMLAFDDIERTNKEKNRKADETGSEAAFPQNYVEENRKLYLTIFSLAHNPDIINAAEKAGIDLKSDDFNEFVSIMARQKDIFMDSVDKYDNTESSIENSKIASKSEVAFTKWLEDNGLLFVQDKKQKKSGHRGHPINEQKREELRKKFEEEVDQKYQLAELGALIDLIETYSAVQNLTHRLSRMLKTLQGYLDDLNKRRESDGFAPINTTADVEALVKDKIFHDIYKPEYSALYGLTVDVNMAEDIWLNALTGKEVVENGKKKRMYTGKSLVDRYKNTSKSDRDLQETLENDFFETLRRDDEIKKWVSEYDFRRDNSFYQGFDGKWYYAKKVKSQDGSERIVKYEMKNGRPAGRPMFFDDEEFYTYHEMVKRDADIELGEDSTEEERREAGERRLGRERINFDFRTETLEEFHQNRAKEIAELESQGQESDPEKPTLPIESFPVETLQEPEEPITLSLEQLEQEDQEIESTNRVEQMFAEGWMFYTRPTKRGKVKYMAKLGNKKISLSQEEGEEAMALLNTLPPSQNATYKPFLSGKIEDYEYDPASYKGNPGSHNATEEAVIGIMNAAYEGNEARFNELLTWSRNSLTNDLIDELKLLFAEVNGHFARDVKWVEDLYNERAVKADKLRVGNEIYKKVSDFINKYSIALFKFGRLIANMPVETVEEWVNDFSTNTNKQYRSILLGKGKKGLTPQGINKALLTIALVRAKFRFIDEGNGKYSAQAETGERHDISKAQYEFAEYVKDKFQPKQLELSFNEESVPQTNPQSAEVLLESEVQPEFIPETPAEEAPAEIDLGTQLLQQGLGFTGSFLQNFKESISTRPSKTQQQDDIINLLSAYDKELNPDILHQYTTASHYFIREGGKVVLYKRVHEYLKEKEQDVLNDVTSKRYNSASSIYNKLVNAESYKDYVDAVHETEKAWNDVLAEKYGINSYTYEKRAICLAGYTLEDIYNDSKEEAARAIANIASINEIKNPQTGEIVSRTVDILKRYVDAGNIVDEIIRDILSDKNVVYNSDVHKMSRKTFDAFVENIKDRKSQLDRIGIRILTNEIITFAEINGVKVAGVMDMVAVDPFGNTYIIDFKTTYKYNKYNKKSTTGTPIKGILLQELDEELKSLGEDETIEFNRQSLEGYRKLLSVYRHLLKLQHGIDIKHMFIAPILVSHKLGKNELTGLVDTHNYVFGGFNEGGIRPYKVFKIDPDNSMFEQHEPEPESIDYSEIDTLLDNLSDKFEQTSRALSDKKDFYIISSPLSAPYIMMKAAVDKAQSAVDMLKDGQPIEELSVRDFIMAAQLSIEQFNNTAKEYFIKKDSETQQPLLTVQNGGIPNTPQGHQLNPAKRDPYGDYRKYNNLEIRNVPIGWSQQKWRDFKRVSALPDFLEKSRWELNTKSYIRIMDTLLNTRRAAEKPSINVTIYYTEHKPNGSVVEHQFGGILMHIADENNGVKMLNKRLESPLMQKIDSILFDKQADGTLVKKPDAENKRIILTNKSRTNGVIQFDNNNMRNVQIAIGINDAEIEGLQDGNSIGQLGLMSHGSIRPITKSRNDDIIPIYTFGDGREMTDGMVGLKRNLPYTEDKDTPTHTPIIPLTPKQLHESDIDLILDILKNYGKYVNQSYKITIGGKEYESPVRANAILNNLIRFGDSARKTQSRFVFDFIEEDGKTNFSKIQITNWGTDQYSTYDLTTAGPMGIDGLREHLKSGGYVYYNNENLMRHGTSRGLDTTPGNLFENLEQFFKDHPEINQIKYSDSMVFDRKDVDPDENGSYNGIRGYHWMMRHGWMLSAYQSIELPVMAATDAEEGVPYDETQTKSEKKKTEPVLPKQPTQQQTGILPTVEDITKIVRDGDSNRPSEVDDPTVGPVNLWQDPGLGNLYGEEGPVLPKTAEKRAEALLDEELAKRRISHILGKNFPVRFIPDVIKTLKNGHVVVGQLNRAGITLASAAENGVEFHEAFHAIVEILLPEVARKRLYEHYRQKYAEGRKLNDRAVAEGLADLYYEFKIGSPEIRLTWNITKMFKNIWQYSKALWSINDIKMSALFWASDLGLMKLFKADSAKFETLARRFGEGLNYELALRDGRKSTLKNFNNHKEVDDLVEVLLYKMIHDYGVEVLGSNLDRLDTRYSAIATLMMATKDEKKSMTEAINNLKSKYGDNAIDHIPHSKAFKQLVGEGFTDKQLLKALQDGKISPLAHRNAMMFREAFDKWDVFRTLVEEKLKQKGVDKKRIREEQTREDRDGGEGYKQEEFSHFDQPFYEHSMRDDVPTRIKFFLSTRPNRRWATPEDVKAGFAASTHMDIVDEDGKKKRVRIPVDVRNNSMGYSTYASYQLVYNTLLRTAHHAKSIKEFDDILHKLGENDFLLYNIAKSYHNFRRKMYIRYQSENDGKYRNIPKVVVNGKLLNPSEYISDIKHLTEDEEFPTVVRYTHDVYDEKTSKLLHRQGDIIQEAIIQTDADYEQLVVQLFQAVHAQKLDYQFMFASGVLQVDGKPTGRYSYKTDSTNVDQSMQSYPHLWFDSIRSAWGGILTVDKDSNVIPVVYDDGRPSRVFTRAAMFFRDLRSHTASQGKLNRHNVVIDGEIYDMSDPEGFDIITSKIIQVLNSIGVDITKQAFNYMLLSKYPHMLKIEDALVQMLNSSGIDSINPLIDSSTGILETLQTALDTGNFGMFTYDTDTTGSTLYAKSGFLMDLAKWVGKYRLAAQESMTLGPENTKMYTYAQHHSASDTTDSLNDVFDDDGNMKTEGVAQDLRKSPYVLSEDGREGSIIIRNVLNKDFNPRHNRLVLSTSSGVKLNIAGNGGTKYSEITVVEDWLSKAAILQDGHIIFPTLSDKSTWFFLRGIRLPGFNYDDFDERMLPIFTHTGASSRMLFDRSDYLNGAKQQKFYKENRVLDQFIEYAYRELDFVNQTINQLGIQDVNLTNEKHLNENDKIKNFHTGEMHGARFAFLTGVYGVYDENDEFDENKDVFYDFNIYDPANPEQSVLLSRERAMRTFFDKREGETDRDLKARQRSMIANVLQHRMMDQLNDLVDKGIIERLDVNLAKFRSGKIDMRVSPFLGFKNNLLDDKKIQLLKEYYKKQPLGNGTYGNVFTEAQLESAAIAAYVYDITAKSIMSKEETQRVYTGFPHFFKWKFDEEGHLVDIMEDESKRLGGEGSTGTSNVLDLPNLPKTYRVAEIKDWEITSPFARALTKAFKDNEYRDALINKRLDKWHDDHLGKTLDDKEADAMYDEVYSMPLDKVAEELGDDTIYLDEKIKAESESYVKDSSKNLDGINVADGTAFITDKMAENLLRMRGAWNNDVKHAFEHLRGNKRAPLNSAKAYRIIYDALIGTLKYSAFGYRMQNGVPVHYYNKYALFPIFKDIAYGFTSELYKKMNDPKTGVDMVMMTSAVKAGSLSAQKFNPEMTADDLAKFSFKDNTYVQQFSLIRRQLNTDPHEKESQPMGTQAVKVALSTIRDNLLYTRVDGSQVRGRDLKNSIMDNIKKLSEIGKKRLTDRFFKDDKFDITEFARFAEEELGDRGADKNLLDAIRSLYQNPSTILNSVSNMAWIESVMVSIINKNIIDVNLPGNAFYQRSVFGMEGIMSDSQFPTLNGGRPLQMINEEGSMDAVISIDYFYNIIPRQYRYNFDKAKQWLIDNGIISGVKSWSNEWSNAKANTISYRIPTQGISSVHALRFVDVIPIVRDTIVLPKEFTKITGSDFDIDKLYLSSINYKMIKSKDDYLPVQRDIFDATDKFDKETEADMYYQNELVNDYLTLLKDAGKVVKNENPDADNELLLGRYIHYLHRSIDNDTSLVKDVLKEVEKNRQRKPVEPFVVGSLYTQSNLKDSFITGKFLIAPFALNLNGHIMTQLYNVGFKSATHGIMTALGAESLARRNDRDGNSILSWLSAFINACVDVAKDPYILRLNVNKYTVNNTILLIRTGFGKDALYFTRQPILKNLATKVLNESGDVVADPSLSPYQRQIQTEKQYALAVNYGNDRVNQKIKRLYGWGNNKYNDLDFQEDEAVFKALFGILPDKEGYDTYVKKSKTILQDLITNRDVLIDKDGDFTVENMREDGYYEINGTKYSPRALQGYVFIAKKLFDDYSEALNNLVQTTKIDTKKHGINFLELQDYLSRYNDLKNYKTNMFDENLISRDGKSGMLVESFIDQKTNDAINMLPRILKSQMIHMTDGFRDMVNKVSQTVNNNSKDTRAEIQKLLLTYIKQKVMNRIMEERGINWDNIIHGPNNLATRIVALKHKIQSDTTGKYSYFASYGVITNQFLENLYPVPYQPAYGQDRYSLIQLDNSLDDDPDIENAYIDGWQLMWESDDEEIKNIALDLAIYAFMTSGDNRGFTKFFKYVPLKLREDIGYVSYMNTMYDLFNLRQMLFTDYGHDFSLININEFLRNNWRNNKIIPVFNPWRNGKYTVYGNKTIYRDINKANGIEIYRNTWEIFAPTRRRDGSPTIGTNPVTGLYPPFIKMRRPYASSRDADPYLLYRLVSIGIDKEGHEKPIYALANQKGISVRAGSQLFEIFEYDRNDLNSHIMTGHYLDDINWEEVAQKIANSFVEKYKADPTFRVNDNTFLDKNSLPEGTPWVYNYKVGIDLTTGNETVSTEASAMYGTLLMEMWRAERNARRVEKEAVEQNRPITENLRWSDKFKKFCKGK